MKIKALLKWQYLLYVIFITVCAVFILRIVKELPKKPKKISEKQTAAPQEKKDAEPTKEDASSDIKQPEKADMIAYLKNVSSTMTEVDIMLRNAGLKYITTQEAAKRMDAYISKMKTMQCVDDMARLHTMILLSFKKIRTGLLLFSPERKEQAVKLMRNGAGILKSAAKDMLELAKAQGLVKPQPETSHLGEVNK